MQLDQQWHGYRRGHQLIASTTELGPRDQDLVDKLSDGSGSPRPGELFEPYLTIYPLPSGQFQVVARTWQDREAPRSGTVFTRSLLVHTDLWRSIRSLKPLMDVLSDREVTGSPVELATLSERWPALADTNLSSLTESLFLEQAAAIAAFGFIDSEIIAGRLLEALWPSRRATFAVCTYALGPRSLPDRDFDLVFAPETVRSRFAKWSGRKIIAAPSARPPRHAWTDQITRRVFEDPEPSLAELDEIGALDAGSRNDNSSLRLALLWGDLKQKAVDSPTSLLGMLDVLSSLGRRPWALPQVASLVVQALQRLSRSKPEDAWQFLQLLVRKLGDDIPLHVVRQILEATRILANSEPRLVIAAEGDEAAVNLPHLLRPAVARGLADLGQPRLDPLMRSIPPSTSVALMAVSPKFATAATISLSGENDASVVAAIARTAAEDRRAARRLASGASRGARSSAVAPFLKVALQSAPRENFAVLSQQVLAAGGSAREELLDMLIDVSRSISAQDALRPIALSAPVPAEGDRLLLGLVRDRVTTTWLIEALADQLERLFSLLLRLMDKLSDGELREALGGGRNKDSFLEAAIHQLPSSSGQFVRLISNVPANPKTNATVLAKAWPRLGEAERIKASMVLLDQLLSLEPETAPEILALVLATGDTARIINEATSTTLSAALVGRNVAVIARSPSVSRFTARADAITARLVERRSGSIGQTGYEGWARLLRLARQQHPEALLRSADAALDYTLSRPNEPAGAVVAAAFPVVYARLKKNSLPEIPFNLITAVLIASIALFTEWDRAKAARHGLVDAFLRSKWEPVELLRAGIDAGIPKKVLGYLVSKPGGREYLRRIERGAAKCPEPTRIILLDVLSEFNSARTG